MISFDGSQQLDQEMLNALIVSVKAILYARVSTIDQAEQGYSLQSQIERCANYGKTKFGYRDDEMLAIIEPGQSGDNPDRPGINMAMYLIEQGVGKKLILLHPDRLARDNFLQHQLSNRVWSNGVDLEFVEMTVDPSNPESMLMFDIQGSIAAYNKKKILANSKRGRLQKVKNGKIPGIHRVYGYTFDKELDTLVENPVEKANYLTMVNWLLNGKAGRAMNCSQIARELAVDGVPAPLGDNWYQATVSRILRNRLYLGTFYYGKSEVVQSKGKKKVVKKPMDQWQGIPVPRYIDEETFLRIQKRLDSLEKKHRGRPSELYLLKGIARCGRCGGAVVAGVSSTLKNGEKLRYYACSRKVKKKFKVGTGESNTICVGRSWRQDIVDDYVWKYIVQQLQNLEQVFTELIKRQGCSEKLETIRAKQERINKVLDRKLKQRNRYVEMYAKDLITMKELEHYVQPLNKEVENLTAEMGVISGILTKAEQPYDETERVREAVNRFHHLVRGDLITYELKSIAVRKLLQQVTLNQNTIELTIKHSKSIPSQGYGGLQGFGDHNSGRLPKRDG